MHWRLGQYFLIIFCGCAQAQIQMVPGSAPLCVFAGEKARVPLTIRNGGARQETFELHVKISQAASGVVMPIEMRSVETLTVLAGQTILEEVPLHLPAVRAESTFILQWLRGTNAVIGATRVTASPRGVLAELKQLCDGKPVALFDPENRVRDALKAEGLETVDPDPVETAKSSCRLAIIWSANTRSQTAPNFFDAIPELVKGGVGVIRVCPPASDAQLLAPSIQVKSGSGENAVVLVERSLLAGLSDSPCSQKRLLQLARVALGKASLSSLEKNLKEVP